MVSRFTNLTDVTLETKCGDSSLVTIGERCEKLKKLTLSRDNGVTNEGFIAFARSQQRNNCLDEIVMLCPHSQISLRGLSQVWLLPLTVKTLHCHGVQFDCATDDDDIPLECPNGPTKLTNLSIKWHMMTDIQISSAMKLLKRTEVLFPALQRMTWIDPPHDMVISDNIWGTVESFNQSFDSAINLKQLANCFPKIASLNMKNMNPL